MAKKLTKTGSFSNCVGVSEAYLKLFHSYLTTKEAEPISKMLNDRTKALKPNAGSYRQVNSWDQYGLIDVDRDGSEWRKYSIIDAVWLNIIAELRVFAFSIDKIKITKTSLEEGANKRSTMPFLEFCVFRVLMEKDQILILVFSDGSATPLSLEDYNRNIAGGKLKNHIRIYLNDILLRQFENNKNMKPVYEECFIQMKNK